MQIYRHLYKKLSAHLEAKEISLIVGPRQTSKMALLKLLP